MSKQRIAWIDMMRGLAMLAILWFHTESYYCRADHVISYDFYVANVLTAFFFISGFLFGRKEGFSLTRKLRSIVRGLLLPYFVFTLLLAVPKSVITGTPLPHLLINILLGKGSWFITALTIGEAAFALSLCIKRQRLFHLLPWAAVLLAWWLTGRLDDAHNYWKVHNALIAFFFIYLGWLCRQHQQRFLLLTESPASAVVSLLLIIGIKVYESSMQLSCVIDPMTVNCYPLFLPDMAVGIVMLTTLSRLMPQPAFVRYVGINSLFYYFFCGAVPTAVSLLLSKAGLPEDGHRWRIVVAFTAVCLVSTAVVAVVNSVVSTLKKRFAA